MEGNRIQKRKSWKNMYTIYTAVVILLSGLFFYIFLVTAPSGVWGEKSADEGNGTIGVPLRVYDSSDVFDPYGTFTEKNPRTEEFMFPKLAINKAKLTKGFQLVLNSTNVQEIGQFRSKDTTHLVNLVQRSYINGSEHWTQVDAIITDPAGGKYEVVPTSYNYGNWPEQIKKGNMVLGFTGESDMLILSTQTEGDDLVYTVVDYDWSTDRMTPIMDVLRISPSQTSTSYIVSGWVTSDNKYLMFKDNHDKITEFKVSDGAMLMEFVPPVEGRSNGNYIASSVKDVIMYYSESLQPTVWLIDAAEQKKSQPFLAESGYIEPGFDASSKIIYYNFTYDRSNKNILTGTHDSLLTAKGVQIAKMDGSPLMRFALSPDSDEFLEFAGYIEDKNVVILHKYTVARDTGGEWFKQTVDWMTGDMQTGEMASLQRLNVPDRWDKKDIFFTTVKLDGNPDSYIHCFINLADGTYYLPKWKNRELMKNQDQDLIVYTDEPNQRVYSRSFTRPDLGVSLLNYKKYKFETSDFLWMTGGFLAHTHPFDGGLRLYFMMITP
ncbi:MAG: hypothetical protein K0R75_1333 [Paenibacillaceae bacterium]|jgi:hypothetical protein|nr:hypothetical protein [Paenibacillaceae bacterium]